MRACDPFFANLHLRGEAVTYDEVRLRTSYSKVPPHLVDLKSWFSRHVPVKIPIISAAMDTVTESRMAIAMAELGGLGIIHRNLTPEQQRDEVRRVKFHLSGVITSPITVQEDMAIETIETMRREREFSFHSFPVLNSQGKLVGLLTENDFDFCRDRSSKAGTVMTTGLITASPDTSITAAYRIMCEAKKKVLPLIDAEGNLKGMYLFSDLKRIVSGSSDAFNLDAEGRLRVGAAIGTGEEALERVALLNSHVDVIVIDTAHGDSEPVFVTLREIKHQFPDLDVVVGNVSEGESATRLADAGADGVKVGQGPGSICFTRIVAGIGCPQVTAVYEVTKALEGRRVPACADGGIEYSGSIPIAIGAGAETVMLGKLLAGTKEAPGDVTFDFDTPMKHYRGMGSMAALESSSGSRERYRQSGKGLVPEGAETVIPYIGDVETAMVQYIGGLRAGMGYAGTATIEELRLKGNFWRISMAGVRESHPHGVRIVRSSPNYQEQT